MGLKNFEPKFPTIDIGSEYLFVYNTDSLEAIGKCTKIETGFLRELSGIGARGIPIVREDDAIKIALPLRCHERKDRMREMEAIGVYATQNEINPVKLLTEGGMKIQEETERVTGGFIGYREIVAKTYWWLEENSKHIGDILKKDKFAIYFSPVKEDLYYNFKNWNFDTFIVIS